MTSSGAGVTLGPSWCSRHHKAAKISLPDPPAVGRNLQVAPDPRLTLKPTELQPREIDDTSPWKPGQDPWRKVYGRRPGLHVVAARLRANQGRLELRDAATLLEAKLAESARRRGLPRPGILSTDSRRLAAVDGSPALEANARSGHDDPPSAPSQAGV